MLKWHRDGTARCNTGEFLDWSSKNSCFRDATFSCGKEDLFFCTSGAAVCAGNAQVSLRCFQVNLLRSGKQQATRNQTTTNNNQKKRNKARTGKERRFNFVHAKSETNSETVDHSDVVGQLIKTWRFMIACSQNQGRQRACCGRPAQ